MNPPSRPFQSNCCVALETRTGTVGSLNASTTDGSVTSGRTVQTLQTKLTAATATSSTVFAGKRVTPASSTARPVQCSSRLSE